MDDPDSTELIKVTGVRTYGVTDLAIETKRSGEAWPRHYGEFGPVGYQHHRVFKLALYSPGSGNKGGVPRAPRPARPPSPSSFSLSLSLSLFLSLSLSFASSLPPSLPPSFPPSLSDSDSDFDSATLTLR